MRGTLRMPGAVVRIAGQRLRLQVAHPMPPMPGQLDVWRTELGRLRAYAAGRGEEPTLIAGDFNATQDHAAFRSVLDTGLRDSARATGVSRTPSWPSATAPVLGAQIDHVLASRALRPRTARFLELPAHRPPRAAGGAGPVRTARLTGGSALAPRVAAQPSLGSRLSSRSGCRSWPARTDRAPGPPWASAAPAASARSPGRARPRAD